MNIEEKITIVNWYNSNNNNTMRSIHSFSVNYPDQKKKQPLPISGINNIMLRGRKSCDLAVTHSTKV